MIETTSLTLLKGARLTRLFKSLVFVLLASFSLAACGDDKVVEGAYTFKIDANDLVIGQADAPVTVVEYFSFACPHCAEFHEIVFPTLREKYIDTGKMRFVLRPFPNVGSPGMVSAATYAALLVKCAPQDKQLPLTDALLRSQLAWLMKEPQGPRAGINKIARQALITAETAEQCSRNQDNIAWMQGIIDEATEVYDVNSTPAIYVNGNKFVIRSMEAALEDFDRIMADFAG
ncbi:MAG: DsbA family protein [Alphaproteobacteria bacterium]|nr:MAG: DsbA family protein [Alphaproteobacteria bacterium]